MAFPNHTFWPFNRFPPASNLEQDALAHGNPVTGIPLHTCTCPPCFTAVERGGKITCTPK